MDKGSPEQDVENKFSSALHSNDCISESKSRNLRPKGTRTKQLKKKLSKGNNQEQSRHLKKELVLSQSQTPKNRYRVISCSESKKPIFKCPKCDYKRENINWVDQHYRVIHCKQTWICPDCNAKKMAWDAAIKRHQLTCPSRKKPVYEVIVIESDEDSDEGIDSRNDGTESLRSISLSTTSNSEGETGRGKGRKRGWNPGPESPKFQCSRCNYFAGQESVIKEHEECFHDRKEWNCPRCSKVLRGWKYGIKYHKSICPGSSFN